MQATRRQVLIATLCAAASSAANAAGQLVQTPYKAPMKVVFEFYLDDPATLSNALFWVRSVFTGRSSRRLENEALNRNQI